MTSALSSLCQSLTPLTPRNAESVSLVWGILGIDRSTADINDPLGNDIGTTEFDETFDFTQAETRRFMYTAIIACNNSGLVSALGQNIWLYRFAEFVRGEYSHNVLEPFPSATVMMWLDAYFDHYPGDRSLAGFELNPKKRLAFAIATFKSSNLTSGLSAREAADVCCSLLAALGSVGGLGRRPECPGARWRALLPNFLRVVQ